MAYGLQDAIRNAAERIKAEEEKRNAASAQGLDDLKHRIDEINGSYETEKPPAVEAPALPAVDPAYKEYEAPTDEELRRIAESNLTDSYLGGKQNIESDASKRAENLAENKREAAKYYEEATSRAEDYYEEAKRSSSDSALKRGLARSSIAQLSQDELNKSQADAKTRLESEFAAKLSDLDREIADTEAAREAALKDYDLKHAAKLTQELEKLKTERTKRQDEVLEYNNALAQKLQELAMKRTDWENKYAADADKTYEQLRKEAEQKRAESVYREVGAYLSTLDKRAAQQALRENPYFRSVLSDRDYAKLYDVYFR